MALPSEIRKGDPITADWLNRILREVKRLSNIRGSGGVEIVSTGSGVTFRGSASADFAIKRGRLDEDLAEDGTAELSVTEWNSDSEEWLETDEDITVRVGLPISEDIAQHSKCWAVKVFGQWFLIAVNCN